MEVKWSHTENLSQTVRNPNIIIKGTHSYYSGAWDGAFEDRAVRYLYGDEHSRKNWQSAWEPDKLYIGDYVSIGPEAVILMGGNHTHRTDWISCYPFADKVLESYRGKGDTVIKDGVWIGLRALIMPGVTIGEGAIVAAGAVVTKDLEPYTIYGGNPAKEIRKRFAPEDIKRILKLRIYDWPEEKFNALKPFICAGDAAALEQAAAAYAG